MLHAVRVAGNVAVQVLLEQLLSWLLLGAQTAARNEIGTCLQLAAHFRQAAGDLDVFLHGTIALRVRDDHLVAHTLQLENRALVHVEL